MWKYCDCVSTDLCCMKLMMSLSADRTYPCSPLVHTTPSPPRPRLSRFSSPAASSILVSSFGRRDRKGEVSPEGGTEEVDLLSYFTVACIRVHCASVVSLLFLPTPKIPTIFVNVCHTPKMESLNSSPPQSARTIKVLKIGFQDF